MKMPDMPANEADRLRDLRASGLLDSDPEERFDRLTRMARRALDTPIALVSLVDENRLWFKSSDGLDAREVARDVSFCGHAILGDEIFVVENTLDDSRFADNPLVADSPEIRFYAGVPLRYETGSRLGTLCVIDRKPRRFGAGDLQMLRDLGEMAESELKVQWFATTDELTGLSNRRGFLSLAQNSLSLCARQDVAVSLACFDLKEFGPINERFSHAEGDRALQAFAYLMRKTFRDSDVCARLGGDEFAVLLTNTPGEQAAESVDRLRHEVDFYNGKANRGYELRFADGIASLSSREDCSVSDLLEQADERLCRQKT